MQRTELLSVVCNHVYFVFMRVHLVDGLTVTANVLNSLRYSYDSQIIARL